MNSMLLLESIKDNKITTLFQNHKRSPDGKQVFAELPCNALVLLMNLKSKLKDLDVFIVPVSINYERIIESAYITCEVPAELPQITKLQDFVEAEKKLDPGRMGKVIIKYLKPARYNDLTTELFS